MVLLRLFRLLAAAALNGPDDCIRDTRVLYKKRRDVLIDSFARAGWQIPAARASMFAWAPIPNNSASGLRWNFHKLLIEKADLAVAPGIGFGEHGEGFVRFGLVENEQRIRQACTQCSKVF